MALVIINPICGDRSAPLFLTDSVLPLLAQANIPLLDVVTTASHEHAPALVAQHLNASPASTDPLIVVLASGDGTLHDILTAVARPGARPVHFVLVPCGTANALYSSLMPPDLEGGVQPEYRLRSTHAFIEHRKPTHLALASTTIYGPGREAKERSVSAVVVSTSLHAAILHDSEKLREEYPGIERFKIAAEQNSTKWYNARLTLTPARSQSAVQIYDPASDAFVPYPNSPTNALTLSGPFAYFLSTINVDRLEPLFRIAPLARSHPSQGQGTADVVVIRPLRTPGVGADTLEAREAFAKTTWAVLGGAYQDGAHVQLRYPREGEEGRGPAKDEKGEVVVEYFRCGGWEWVPDEQDEAAHLVCADGAISSIPKGGNAVCEVDAFEHGFAVYSDASY